MNFVGVSMNPAFIMKPERSGRGGIPVRVGVEIGVAVALTPSRLRLADPDHHLDPPGLQGQGAVLVPDRPAVPLTIEADRTGFLARLDADVDRLVLARLAARHRVSGLQDAAEG